MRGLKLQTCDRGLPTVNHSIMLFDILAYLALIAGVSYLALTFPRVRNVNPDTLDWTLS